MGCALGIGQEGDEEVKFVGLDPATNTGFVMLDEHMNVLAEEVLKGKGKGPMDIAQLVSLEDMVFRRLKDTQAFVAIEEAAVGTQMAYTTGMIHGGVRSMVHRARLDFDDVNPTRTKKYVGVTGWVTEAGKKRRLDAKEKKATVMKAVHEHFGYSHKNDNVVDAYIIARIAVNLWRARNLLPEIDRMPYQLEVIQSILEPNK